MGLRPHVFVPVLRGLLTLIVVMVVGVGVLVLVVVVLWLSAVRSASLALFHPIMVRTGGRPRVSRLKSASPLMGVVVAVVMGWGPAVAARPAVVRVRLAVVPLCSTDSVASALLAGVAVCWPL